MPHSDTKLHDENDAGRGVAILAESLYLTNLLLLPGLAFIILLLVYLKNNRHPSSLARCHLQQTLIASVIAGVMLVIVNVLIVLLGGLTQVSTWVVVILYFTLFHATFVVLGTLGLARAMAGKHYHYPFIGRSCSEN